MFFSCFRKIVESVGCGVECVETVESVKEKNVGGGKCGFGTGKCGN